MSRSRTPSDPHLLSKVSSLYYLQNQTQQEIADRLRLSRPKVSRLLNEAQERGIVQISVTPPQGLHIKLEARVEERFGLDEAIIVDVEEGHSPDLLLREIGAAAAAYLGRIVQPGEAIGLAWGTTLRAMVQSMSPLATRDVSVVQMLGGIGPPEAEAYAAGLVRRLAHRLGASATLLAAPAILGTAAAKEVLREDPHVRMALGRLDTLDTVFVGIGSLTSNPVLRDSQSFPASARAELQAAGAIGDIALRFFDAEGNVVHTSLEERMLSITVEQLRRVKRVVAVAGGPEKGDAIFAALKMDIIDVLVTDRLTAETLVCQGA
jgi:DNA-binding transcriptional regulator LsrR (DeoR family)